MVVELGCGNMKLFPQLIYGIGTVECLQIDQQQLITDQQHLLFRK